MHCLSCIRWRYRRISRLAGRAAKRVEDRRDQRPGLSAAAGTGSRTEDGLAATSLGDSTHRDEDSAQRIAAQPIAFANSVGAALARLKIVLQLLQRAFSRTLSRPRTYATPALALRDERGF
jgi:hypothetical protein